MIDRKEAGGPPRTHPVELAVDEFVAAWLRGEAPDPVAFCEGHPGDRDVLRSCLDDFLFMAAGLSAPQAPESAGAFEDAGRGGSERRCDGGMRLGRYELRQEIGRGGQGVVYLAEDTRLHRMVAVKVLRGSGLDSRRFLARFQREAEVASRLEHPGICSVYDTGMESGIPYIVMRYVAGRSLAQLIAGAGRARTPSPPELDAGEERVEGEEAGSVTSPISSDPRTAREIMGVLKLLEKAAMAVHAAHDAGVIHRDLKPGNIMVTRKGEPVITDFGLALSEEGDSGTLTRSGQLFGTPAYMSPEQLTGGGHRLDRRTDVYSLGVTLYECLTLRRPFEAPTREGLFAAILGRDPPDPRPFNPQIAADLKVVLETALEKDLARRYQTARDFAEELRRVREHEPIEARPATTWTRLHRWGQRNPRLAAAVTAAVLSLLAGLVATLHEKSRADRNAASARASAKTATDRLEEWERLADGRRLEDLIREANEDLWPTVPEKIEAMDRWLGNARRLVQRRNDHRRALGRLRIRGRLEMDADDRLPPAEGGWRFEDREDQFKHDRLQELLAGLETLAGERQPWTVSIREMERRREAARTIRGRSLEANEEAWREAITRVARSDRYGGLRLKEIVGLVPMGKDPESGLEEFGDIQTGELATRDPQSRRIPVTEETGLVFVLLPGEAAFTVGAQKADPRRPNFDPNALGFEGPTHEVSVLPLLLSKYEMTQGQWLRVVGENPSMSGSYRGRGDERFDLRYPVECVSWVDCMEALRPLGFGLPTETQWEYACRGGRSTPWSTGETADSLAGYANLGRHDLGDGYRLTAPVGSFSPNPFGLHDMHGNVQEWCLNGYLDYGTGLEFGKDLHPSSGGPLRMVRGGDWRAVVDPLTARSACRTPYDARLRIAFIGVRPALEAEPP